MRSRFLFLLPLALIILGQGCPPPVAAPEMEPMVQDVPVNEADGNGMTNEATMDGANEEDAVDEMGTPQATFVPFTKDAYDEALASNDAVVLFFYANWCPFCQAQEPVFRDVVAQTDFPLRTFRVNYADSDTDADEKALAQSFGIFTQHTLVFLDGDGNEVDRIIGTLTAEPLREKLRTLR